ncbi:hypothetical protein BOTBODRAFT_190028 [Botryobasidium botryosum FD-172 SS1]|uniref:Nickel/cobalt efflux system n=1 Tax=Botryobasidium botryosum (strain FD-172 SS1) TaxID=930990 RepID=A0A067M8N7_BOTB1|nr:hypothetical protein BOTBODRAFT_190028 [Botryobasidium botryosum FD-172 SS1]
MLCQQRLKLTLFGRSLILISAELLANVVCWIVALLLFARREQTRGVMSLCLLAWTIGLRHGLDADHISAIDNATRSLISLGQLPVTCGLYFSLGHSTIVIAVNVAIAISVDVYGRIDGVGSVGGVIGASISGSFLFIIGLANSITLWRILKERRARKKREARAASGELTHEEFTAQASQDTRTLVLRILGPVTKFVDRPWKMYPVGVLFGFGFDTASSIALIAVTALAKRDSDGFAQADIVVLPFLFTAGMTLVDSVDSVLMLYSYSGFPERGLALFRRPLGTPDQEHGTSAGIDHDLPESSSIQSPSSTQHLANRPPSSPQATPVAPPGPGAESWSPQDREEAQNTKVNAEIDPTRNKLVKENTMSGLGIILTLLSILVAFSISIITIMGLIGDNCRPCKEAAEAEDGHGGGLAGRWWRGWAKANDKSGIIGAGIVGGFVAVVSLWYGVRWIFGRWRKPNDSTIVAA